MSSVESPQGGRRRALANAGRASRPDSRRRLLGAERERGSSRSGSLPPPGYRAPTRDPARSKNSARENPAPKCRSCSPTRPWCVGQIAEIEIASGRSPARGPNRATRSHGPPARSRGSTGPFVAPPNRARRTSRAHCAEPIARAAGRLPGSLGTRSGPSRTARLSTRTRKPGSTPPSRS